MFKKKSLGQNFLHSLHYINLIADSAHIEKNERVLEVGPGEGALTKALLERGAEVIAIEKDHRLIPILTEKFAAEIGTGQLSMHEADALEMTLEAIGLDKGDYKVVANIPYYITGALVRKFLSGRNQPSQAVLLVQKEVAERIAREKKESILSLSVKVYGNPKYIKTVPRGAFVPAPGVDSAILSIENISRNNFTNPAHEARFFEYIKTGFAQKRKFLKRNLEELIGSRADELFAAADIPDKARAEDVALSQWLILSKN
jgi:16S rRNA (adenine1518-N6/adenine1519-N6)-dimethyltransferase